MSKVIITDCWYEDIDEEKKIIGNAGAELVYCDCKTEEEVIAACTDADVLIVQFAPVTRRVIENLRKCKAIIRYAIGVDNIDLDAATEHGIYVVNVPDYCVDEVSNHAIALLLCMARKIPQISASVKEGNWDYTLVKPVRRMVGKKLGIIGFGRIGSLVARKMIGFGVEILACDPWHTDFSTRQVGAYRVDLDTLLSESDYITIHTPLNDATYHYIDEEKFAKMKKGVIIVNTSRGKVVDEKALLQALESSIVSAVALDVTEDEPIHPDNPLLKMDNVLITPHFAWYSEESVKLLQQSVANEAVRVLSGELPKNLVNKNVLSPKGQR